MSTAIGKYESERKWLPIAMLFVAFATVANDLRMSTDWTPDWKRAIPVFAAVVAFVALTNGDFRALGIRLPAQSIRHWLIVATILAAILLLLGLGGFLILRLGLVPPETASNAVTDPKDFSARLVHLTVIAPVLEETVYRLILCVPIARFSPLLAVVVSGVTFAGLHFLYGNPGPDNFFAGYLLAWIYLKSGSIYLPILFHAGGNAIILCFQVANWYALSVV
ncbi:MAG: lysostaphin resistance A-like protein [Pirellulales bacterium]